MDAIGWTSHNRDVICKQLGYSKGISRIFLSGTSIKTQNGFHQIRTKCNGSETRLVCLFIRTFWKFKKMLAFFVWNSGML